MATPSVPGQANRATGTPPAAAVTPHVRRPARPPAAAPSRTALISPFTDPDKWGRIVIAGREFTGKISVSGTGFKNKHDRPRARGRNGSRTIANGRELVEFTVTLAAFPEDTDEDIDLHIQELDAIVAALTDEAPARQDASAYPIAYPSLAAARITRVTWDEIDLAEYEAGSTCNQTFKFKSFRDPVARPARTTTTPTETHEPAPQDDPAFRTRHQGDSIAPSGPVVPRPSLSGAASARGT